MDNTINKRIDRLFSFIEDSSISDVIISNNVEPYIDSTFFYLTGASDGIFEDSFVIASRSGESTLVTSTLEEEAAYKSGSKVIITENKKGLDQKSVIQNLLKGCKNLGVNYNGSTTNDYFHLKSLLKDCKFSDVGDAIEKSRIIKDDAEIKKLKRSAEIACAAFPIIKKAIISGLTETKLAATIDYNLMDLGANKPSFDTICAAGKNGALPHWPPSKTAIKENELIVCDYGARYERYCSDVTRTFVYKPKDERQRKIYDTVYDAQKAALDLIRPGVMGRTIYDAAANKINDNGYKGKFIHGIGHSLGLDVHDSSTIFPFGDRALEEGMVLTVEPGIYISGFGGVRIEDDILVTKNGYELLSKAPKKWEEVVIQ